jgi:transposase
MIIDEFRNQYAFLSNFADAVVSYNRGVMVIEVNPAYSSQECSRCHKLTKPNGKSFRCAHCGHNDHRDANAAFTLAQRVSPIGGVAQDSVRLRSVLLTAPFTGTEAQQCA